MTDDGFYTEPWFLESFLELGDDLTSASEKNKRLAIMWELRGCPYCRETHLVNFAKPEIADYIKARFEILQLNIVGSREVTDFDGEKLPEKLFARKYGVRAVPTFQFFPTTSRALRQDAARARGRARARAISSRSRSSTCSASSRIANTKRATCCGCRRAKSSANLEVGKALALQLGHRGDAGRHEFQERDPSWPWPSRSCCA